MIIIIIKTLNKIRNITIIIYYYVLYYTILLKLGAFLKLEGLWQQQRHIHTQESKNIFEVLRQVSKG